MTRVAWRMLWQRPASVVATFLALALAVGIVTTCGVMLESGARFHGATDRYAAAPVLVATTDLRIADGSGEDREVEANALTEQGRVDASLVGPIAAAPGVRAAVADVAVAGRLVGAHGSAAVAAHPWSATQLAPYALRSGTAPRSADQLVLDERLAARLGARLGEHVRLVTAGGPQAFTLTGTVRAAGVTAPTVFLDDARARALSGDPARVDAIGVLADRGVSTGALARAVRAVLPSNNGRDGSFPRVYTGRDRGDVETFGVAGGREFVIAVSAATGGVSLLIAILVIAGSVGLSVTQRHRDIALLRALAATPRQVRRMVVRETVVVGVLAAVAGVWPGIRAAGWLRDQFVAHGLAPDSLRVHVSWLPPLVAGAAAVLVAVLAGWLASLRASRIRPVEAMAENAVERAGLGIVRAVIGLLALGGGITLAILAESSSGTVAASVTVPGVFLLVIAVAAWSPVLLRVLAATFGRLLAGAGVTGQLAAANTRASARRLSAVVSSLVLAVALGGAMWFLPASQNHAARQQSHAGLLADHVLEAAAPGLPTGLAGRLASTDGVRSATPVVHSTVFNPKDSFSDLSALGVDASALPGTIDLDVTRGRLDDLHGNTIALSTLTADSLGLHVGSRFSGWFGDGAIATLRVVAEYKRGLGFADTIVPHDVLLPHTSSRLDDAVLLRTADGSLPAAARAEIARAAPGATLGTAGAYQAEADRNRTQNTWVNQLIALVMLGYAVIAAVNTLVMAALARRREFAILRLAGTTRTQVLRMVRLEHALLLVVALGLGIAIAGATLVPTLSSVTGSDMPYIPPSGWLSLLGGTALLAVAGILPARRALRARPVEAIGARE